jgi:phosphatidylinositol-3,4,5-trisphosphate 5-phosphatase 2
VQALKNRDAASAAADDDAAYRVRASVHIGTFNMGEVAPPRDLSQWIGGVGLGIAQNPAQCTLEMLTAPPRHDVYALGTQEGVVSEQAWIAAVRGHLGDAFEVVGAATLWQMRLVVLARRALMPKVSHIQTSTVATGIANKLGNKGAVGLSFFLGTTSLCFVNCHLTANSENWAKRNANFMDIVARLNLGQKRLAGRFDATNQFHHLFWFGDLNYRINLPALEVISSIKANDLKKLVLSDQLDRQRERGAAFFGFEEGPLAFPPTYRFARGARDTYVYEKQKSSYIKINTPSWCDRVLWKPMPNVYVRQTAYGCAQNIVTSDHSPVFATFEIHYKNQCVYICVCVGSTVQRIPQNQILTTFLFYFKKPP